ncbi:hypothetical protein ScPMuIL_000913 [Solemya velum]
MSLEKEYVRHLDNNTVDKARKELNEIPEERLGAVETFRQWIREQKWLKTPTDTRFLLAMLRARKFSQLGARKLLEDYWTRRTKYPHLFSKVDPADQRIQTLLKQMIYIPLPKRDQDGRKIVLSRPGTLDCSGKNYTINEMIGCALLTFDWLLLDEITQINGAILLMDVTGFSVKHQIFIGIDNAKLLNQTVEKTMPLRLKQLNYYNTGPIFEAFFSVIKQLFSEKMKGRVCIHPHSLETVYKNIDKSILPDEYVPDDYRGPTAGPIDQIIKSNCEAMKSPEVIAALQRLHSPDYGVDLSKKPPDVDLIQASYRKLHVS